MKKIAIVLAAVVVILAGESFAQGYNDFRVEYQLNKSVKEAKKSSNNEPTIQTYVIMASYDESTGTLVGSVVRSDNANARLCSINQKVAIGSSTSFTCGAYQATIAVKRNGSNQIVASGGLTDDHSTTSDLAAVNVKK